MKKASSLALLAFLSFPLAGQLTVPKVGMFRYADGSLHSVQGLPGNLIVCDLPLESAAAASFSDKGGLILQKGVIHLVAADLSVLAEYPSGQQAVLLNIDNDLTSALAWLPGKNILLHWDGEHFAELPIADSDLDGKVIGLQWMGAKQARLLVQHGDDSIAALTFSMRTGNLVSSQPLAGVQGYAFGQSFFFVFSDQNQLVADNLRSYRRSVPLPAVDLLIERMSTNWLHLYSPSLNRDWALHLTQADLELSILPGAAPRSLTLATPNPAPGEGK